MTIEAFRKKVHDPTADDEWCPKRKIKKRIDPRHIENALSNVTIVSKIFDYMVGDDQIMQHLDLRRISRTFESACLHRVRKQFRDLQIVDTKEEDSAEVNGIKMSLLKIPKLFGFLRLAARVRVETIEFAEFETENKVIHDCVMHELVKFSAIHVQKFMGADEICQSGCLMCHALASRARSYGPMQWGTLQQGFAYRRHFQHLLITEILLSQVAHYCLESIVSTDVAFEKMRKIIGENVTCDVLEIVISDVLKCDEVSLKSSTHPRNVIDCIVKLWKPKSVKIKFMTAYSSNENTWQSKHIFEELRFDSQRVKSTVVAHSQRLSHLEIDMMEGDAIADCLLGRPMNPNSSMEKVCSNVKKVFPTDCVYVTLPLGLHDFAREHFDKFCQVLMAFVWNDELNVRNCEFYVRLYCYGLTLEDIEREVQPAYLFNGRPVITSLITAPDVVLDSFGKWHPELCMRNFSPISYVSFRDHFNKCVLHLEVCTED